MIFKPKQLDPEAVKIFSESEVGTLLESIDGKLDLLLENQSGTSNNVKTLEKNYKHLDDRVSKTEIRLDVLEAR